MEDKNDYVAIWESYESYFEQYSDAEVGRLVRAMMQYKWHGAAAKFSGNERFVWPAIKRDIDAAIKKQKEEAEKNRKNGAKGGRPKKAPASEENPENPTLFPETDPFFEKPKKPIEKEKGKEMEKEKETPASSKPPPQGVSTQAAGGSVQSYPVEAKELCAYFEENCHQLRSMALLNAFTNSLLDGASVDLLQAVVDDTALARPDKPAAYISRVLEVLRGEKIRDLAAYHARSAEHKKRKERKNNANGGGNPDGAEEWQLPGVTRF